MTLPFEGHWEHYMLALVTQSCLTLCDPRDCRPPCSSVHGIFQARILEWVAIPFSKGYSRPRAQIRVSYIADGFFFFNLLNHQESPRGTLHKRGLICHGSWHMREAI